MAMTHCVPLTAVAMQNLTDDALLALRRELVSIRPRPASSGKVIEWSDPTDSANELRECEDILRSRGVACGGM